MTNQQLWQAVLGNLEISLSKANFNTWFKNTFISERAEDKVIISLPSAFNRDWIAAKYHQDILKALKSVAPEIREIKYQVGQHAKSPWANNVAADKSEQGSVAYKEVANAGSGLNPKYLFETFIVGKNNDLAHAASMHVAQNPGAHYNPLFIYGGVGLGKTHLMHAVGNKLLRNNPKLKVLYVTSEKFTNDYINAIHQKRMDEFKKLYRCVDMLLIDDIQFIAGKEGTQEEFFHTFNELREAGKQIIITADRMPKEISAIEQRLVSRFEWGMVADIQAPNLETRMAILKAKQDKRGSKISEEVLYFVAENIVSNIRELEGALNRLIVYQQMENRLMNLEQAKEILNSIIHNKKKITSLKKILLCVAEFYNISADDLVKQSRRKEFVKPRQVAMFLARRELSNSFPSIGEFFGNRDHTTVMHGVEKVGRLITQSDALKQEVNLIMDKLYIT